MRYTPKSYFTKNIASFIKWLIKVCYVYSIWYRHINTIKSYWQDIIWSENYPIDNNRSFNDYPFYNPLWNISAIFSMSYPVHYWFYSYCSIHKSVLMLSRFLDKNRRMRYVDIPATWCNEWPFHASHHYGHKMSAFVIVEFPSLLKIWTKLQYAGGIKTCRL